MDQHRLAVDAGAHVHRAVRVHDPELVAVVGTARELSRVRRRGERREHVGLGEQRVADPRCGHDLVLAAASALQQELPEPSQVPERAADPTVGHRVTVCVHRDLGVELRAHRPPQLRGDQVGQARAGRALHDPPEHVRQDRAVVERAAVRSLVLEHRVVRRDVGGERRIRARTPQVDLLVHADVRVEVRVILVEPCARPHVQQVPDRAAFERRAGQLGDVRGHGIRRMQEPALDERAADRGGHRLRDRHQQVRGIGRHAREVPLGHDAAAMQDEEPVRVRVLQEPGERHRPSAGVDHRAHHVALGARQPPDRPVAARDPRRRDQVADVLEPPPVERRILPVREGDEPLRRERRSPLHQVEVAHGSAGASGGAVASGGASVAGSTSRSAVVRREPRVRSGPARPWPNCDTTRATALTR